MFKSSDVCAEPHKLLKILSCLKETGARDSFSHQSVSFVLETPDELQREFVGQEHGGAHREATDGVDRHPAEENLHTRTDSFNCVISH